MSAERLQWIDGLQAQDLRLKAIEEWRRSEAELKAAKERNDRAEEALIMACGQTNFEGDGIKVWEFERKGNVAYDKIPELEGVDLDAYRKPSSRYWKITLSVVK